MRWLLTEPKIVVGAEAQSVSNPTSLEDAMPLINCPDCGKEISDRAKVCIQCGCPLGPSEGQQSQPRSANNDIRKGILVACNPQGGGRIKDIETEETISFSPFEVAEKKLLHGFAGKTVDYEKVNGRLKIHAPADAKFNANIVSNSTSKVQPNSINEKSASNKTDSERVTRNYLWYLMVLIIAVGYWIAKGTPNPALFFAASDAKKECLRLANENKDSIFFNNNEITANDTWLRDGKRVVQLVQKDDDENVKTIMCVYGNGMVQIPSLLEQGRWR